MNTEETLLALLDGAGVSGPELSADDVARLCVLLGLESDSPITEEVIDEVARLGEATLGGDGHAGDEYGFRIGQWRIEIGAGGVRAGILTAIAAAALIQQGIGQVGVAVATAVLPTVLDIERIELSPGDNRLLLELHLKPAVREGFMTEDELYQSLPQEARRTVNRYDFADFVGRLREAGLVDGDEDWMRMRDTSDRRPFISIR